MQLSEQLASYNQVSQHQSLVKQDVQQTELKKSNDRPDNPPNKNAASVVNISFEANRMREQASDIMQAYDLKKISQREMETLSNNLYKTDVINSQQYAALSFYNDNPITLDTAQETELKISPDEPQNMIEKWKSRLEHLRNLNAKPIAQQQAVNMVNLLNNLQSNRI